MNRLLLSFACTALLGIHFSASADPLDTSAQSATDAARGQLDAKRERLSGVDQVGKTETRQANTLLDAPVDTSDAPAQTPQP